MPRFQFAKKGEYTGWRHGGAGGVVRIGEGDIAGGVAALARKMDSDAILSKAKAIEVAGASDDATMEMAPIDAATAAEIKVV